jgi:putative CRISPR-associated protein (TIGR02619 family)
VGTSIAINLGLDREFVNGYRKWDMDSAEHENKLSSKLNEYLRNNSDDEIMRRRLSAELNSLDKLGIEADDRIALLVTDTSQGRMCAEAITSCLIQWYRLPENSIKTERIEGLQVNNQEQLVNIGLINIINKMIDILDKNKYGYEIVFNPTGGYKGIVPFVTAIGMLFGKKIIYIFEHSEALLILPPLPISFNLYLFNRAIPALKYLEKESWASKQAYLSLIISVCSLTRLCSP